MIYGNDYETRFDDAAEYNADIEYKHCVKLAEKLAPIFYNTDPECYDSDEEFVELSRDAWHDWLLEDCYDKDMREAMQYWIDNEDEITTTEWVLKQVKN